MSVTNHPYLYGNCSWCSMSFLSTSPSSCLTNAMVTTGNRLDSRRLSSHVSSPCPPVLQTLFYLQKTDEIQRHASKTHTCVRISTTSTQKSLRACFPVSLSPFTLELPRGEDYDVGKLKLRPWIDVYTARSLANPGAVATPEPWDSSLCMSHWQLEELQTHVDPNGYVVFVNGA